MAVPTIDHVVRWLLRVLYLCFTSSPSATWLASCTLMHMIETAKLHRDAERVPNGNSVPVSQELETYTPQLRSQIYYTAHMFNTWISYDYGQARITPSDSSCAIPIGRMDSKEPHILETFRLPRSKSPAQFNGT